MEENDDCDAINDSIEYENKECDTNEWIVLNAAENGDEQTLHRYLKIDNNLVNTRDSDKYTPLHRAAYNNHLAVAKLLIDYGADIRAQTCENWEPIHSAAKWSHVEMVKLLVNNGAYINALSNGGNTPLHLAALNSDSRSLLEYLLFHHDIDVNTKNNAGDTPYDIAKRSGNLHYLWKFL